jgi:hypothetical protein
MLGRPRIIDVERNPRKCPDCGSSVVDIIYGTDDMNGAEFLLAYRMNAIMGGEIIPVVLRFVLAHVAVSDSGR